MLGLKGVSNGGVQSQDLVKSYEKKLAESEAKIEELVEMVGKLR